MSRTTAQRPGAVAVVPVPWHSADAHAVAVADGVARDLVSALAGRGLRAALHRPAEPPSFRSGEVRALAAGAGAGALVTVRAFGAPLACAVELFDGASERMLFGGGGPWDALGWDAEGLRRTIVPDLARALSH